MEEKGAPKAGDRAATAGSTTTRPRRVLRHAPFSDTFPLNVEPNGRIVLPSVIRGAFRGGGYLRPMPEGYLGLWTTEDFVNEDRRETSRRDRRIAGHGGRRSWYTAAKQVQPDAQGRIVVAESLREAIGITDRLVLQGFFDRLELWEPERHAEVAAQDTGMSELELGTYDDRDVDDIFDIADPDERW
jgi:transcriptional regulator MraZ